MPTVAIHPPKTPVHKGSHTIAKATIPNICKMPGPPAPFVPAPLPNIAKSELSPKDYSTTVKIEGNAVAIRGATFESIGDMASKGTGGGLISANCHGPAKFIAPGSMTVKIEGKNVHLLGDSMLNNLGPSGSPPNTGATMMGADHADLSVDERCAAAKEEAKRLADKEVNKTKKDRANSISVLRKPDGQTFSGRNAPIPGPLGNLLASFGPPAGSPGVPHNPSSCSEKNVVKNTPQTAKLLGGFKGSVITTVFVRGPESKTGLHGQKHEACPNCKALLAQLGIIECP